MLLNVTFANSKKNIRYSLFMIFIFSLTFGQSVTDIQKTNTNKTQYLDTNKSSLTKKQVKVVRKKHAKNLANSPFKSTLQLSKKERKAIGIPPKKYYEMEWELTMDPITGKPTPEKLIQVREQLQRERQQV